MFYTVDRIELEGDCAVAFDSGGKKINIPLDALPNGTKEGDILIYEDGRYIIDEEKTNEERMSIAVRFEKLLKRK